MKKTFDFKRVGRRMPYEVPKDFFSDFRQSVTERLDSDPSLDASAPPAPIVVPAGRRRVSLIRRLSLGAAAAVALFLVGRFVWMGPLEAEVSFEHVATAYSHLSEADQDLLLQLYEDDVFMDENL